MFVENTTSATVGTPPFQRDDLPPLLRMRPRKRVPSSRRRNPGVVVDPLNSPYFLAAGGVVAGVCVPGAAFGAAAPGAGSRGTAGAGAVVDGVVIGAEAGGGLPKVSSRTDRGADARVDIIWRRNERPRKIPAPHQVSLVRRFPA
jgi:hypothetical protein